MFGQSFAHRPKSDGSYDSICVVCFSIAAFGMTEEQLKIAEEKHTCSREVLRRRAEELSSAIHPGSN